MFIQEVRVRDGSSIPLIAGALESEVFKALVSDHGFLEAYVVNLRAGISQVYFTKSPKESLSLQSSVSDEIMHERRVLDALRQKGQVNDVHVVEIQARSDSRQKIYQLEVGLLSDAVPEEDPSASEEAAKEVILSLAPELLHRHVSIYRQGETHLFGSYMRSTGDFEPYDDSRDDENWTPPEIYAELEE